MPIWIARTIHIAVSVFILTLIGAGGSLLPTVGSDVSCAGRKVESLEEISSRDFTSSERLHHSLLSQSIA